MTLSGSRFSSRLPFLSEAFATARNRWRSSIHTDGHPCSSNPSHRSAWVCRFVVCCWSRRLAGGGLLGLARTLEPDPRGYGTHTQLGLRPCAFATLTGRLCPTCGMTTSFAWFMRGRIDRSWRANPAGCLFALLSVPLMAWLVGSAARNEPLGFRALSGPLSVLLMASLVVRLGFWLVRLIVTPAVLARPGPSSEAVARASGLN